MSHVTFPAVLAGFATCVVLEMVGKFGFGTKLNPEVRDILFSYLEKQDEERTENDIYGLWVQGISGVLLHFWFSASCNGSRA